MRYDPHLAALASEDARKRVDALEGQPSPCKLALEAARKELWQFPRSSRARRKLHLEQVVSSLMDMERGERDAENVLARKLEAQADRELNAAYVLIQRAALRIKELAGMGRASRDPAALPLLDALLPALNGGSLDTAGIIRHVLDYDPDADLRTVLEYARSVADAKAAEAGGKGEYAEMNSWAADAEAVDRLIQELGRYK